MTDPVTAVREALSLCPFCGGEASVYVHDAHDHGPLVKRLLPNLPPAPEHHEVCCDSCGVGMLRPTEAEAIAAWNRRTALDALEAALAAATARAEKAEAEVARLRAFIADEHNRVNIVGSDFDKVQQALDVLLTGIRARHRAALKPPSIHWEPEARAALAAGEASRG